MIIDEILDRKEGCRYDAEGFYDYVMHEESCFNTQNKSISHALDCGTNADVQEALCDYIIENGYNPKICDYVKSVIWVED